MDIKALIEDLKDLQRKLHVFKHALGVLSYDSETAAPRLSDEGRGETMGALSRMSYELLINDRVRDLLEALHERSAELDPQSRREAEEMRREYKNTTCIPMEEVVAYTKLVNKATAVWHDAKVNNSFHSFRPCLEDLVATGRRFAGYRDSAKKPYDVMLDDFEPGIDQSYLDEYFGRLRRELVPLVRAIGEAGQPDTGWLKGAYPAALQEKLAKRVMSMMKVDTERCVLGQSEHPFTTNFNNKDVRITTHYHEDTLLSSLYSVIHEAGHGLYELGIADELQYGCLAGGVSMGIHESQSRLYENMLGRSLPFAQALLPVLAEIFPDTFMGVETAQLHRALNVSRPSLIRTESDELTYSMHIMVRYELEKALYDGSLKVSDLPGAWKALYKEYLGVEPQSDSEGVLQDVHWSGGMFGYFPSYSIGSAYSAQIYAAMAKDVDIEAALRAGDFAPINAWLGEKIHRHGGMMKPRDLIVSATGQAFDAGYYINYLKGKYSGLYNL